MSCHQCSKPLTRRQALSAIGGGMGLVGLSNMLSSSLAEVATTDNGPPFPGAIRKLHFKQRAKRIIFLFMNGGVSHVDTFDYKPMLEKYNGKPAPEGNILTARKTGNLMMSPF